MVQYDLVYLVPLITSARLSFFELSVLILKSFSAPVVKIREGPYKGLFLWSICLAGSLILFSLGFFSSFVVSLLRFCL